MLSIYRRCMPGRISPLIRLGSVAHINRQVRNYSDKEDCETKPESKCGIVLKEYPCGVKPTELKKPKPKPKRPPFVSMWNIPDCEPDLCVLDLRYDMKYYRISDKRKRKYQVTWNECPRMLIKPKKVCLYETMVRPKIKRRKRAAAGSLPPQAPKTCGKAENKAASKCVYIKAPCCKIGRRPPKCRAAFRSLGGCTKRKTPYPSFSECKKDAIEPLPAIECRCLDVPALCDAWAVLRRRVGRGIEAYKKCGEA